MIRSVDSTPAAPTRGGAAGGAEPSDPQAFAALIASLGGLTPPPPPPVQPRPDASGVSLSPSGDEAGGAAATASETASETMDIPGMGSRIPSRIAQGLSPEFRLRLERVIARMAAAGHDVSVAEGRRSAVRQQQLFAQGRTAPGPVVTWTMNSRHLDGMAADLRIAGDESAATFQLLHQIAADEGLRTLGARDPGHVELSRGGRPPFPGILPDASRVAAAETARHSAALGAAEASGRIATVAAVAAVATVATVAPVAEVAAVAVPGAPSAGVQLPAAVSAARAGGRSSSGGRGNDSEAGGATVEPARRRPALATSEGDSMSAGPFGLFAGRGGTPSHETAPSAPAGAAPGTAAAERVAELRALRDAAPAPTVRTLNLALDPARDGLSELRLAMRGPQLDATLASPDAGLVRTLGTQMGDLRRSLEQRGLDPAQLHARLDGAVVPSAIESVRDTTASSAAWDGARQPRDDRAAQEGAAQDQRRGRPDSWDDARDQASDRRDRRPRSR